MNCPQCGAPLGEGAKFCKYCGESIAPAQQYGQPPTPPAAPPQYTPPQYTPQQPQQQYTPPQNSQNYYVPQQAEVPFSGNTWLVPNIILTVFCCNILSIIGIVFGAMSSSKIKKGQYNEARSNANTAKILFIIGLILGVIGGIIGLASGLLPAILNGSSYY